jgi:hypothetical protein
LVQEVAREVNVKAYAGEKNRLRADAETLGCLAGRSRQGRKLLAVGYGVV